MAIEIERKFLVTSEGWRPRSEDKPRVFRQAYLALSERAVVRVRLDETNATAWLCVKERKIGASRGEFEYPVPLADGRALLKLATGHVIEKQRFLVPHNGHVWEVDEFDGANAGLVVAEIELEHEDEAFSRPAWLGEEVTGEERYYNASLALFPWRDWGEEQK
jgi:adenylate cyclase